jgi:hypothetical protein
VLYTQITHGAPFDLFLSADVATLKSWSRKARGANASPMPSVSSASGRRGACSRRGHLAPLAGGWPSPTPRQRPMAPPPWRPWLISRSIPSSIGC